MKSVVEDIPLQQFASGATPESIVRWGVENLFPNLAMTTALQVSGVALMDIVHKIEPRVPFIFIDTGYHFPETLLFRDELISKFGYNIVTIAPELPRERFEQLFGEKMYERNPDKCCQLNKVQPRVDFTKQTGISNWISGLRRDQGGKRAGIEPITCDSNGHYKLYPLALLTWQEVWDYVKRNHLPYNRLYDQGYSSIGCHPASCTIPNPIENGERNGRWTNSSKTECGLHFESVEGTLRAIPIRVTAFPHRRHKPI